MPRTSIPEIPAVIVGGAEESTENRQHEGRRLLRAAISVIVATCNNCRDERVRLYFITAWRVTVLTGASYFITAWRVTVLTGASYFVTVLVVMKWRRAMGRPPIGKAAMTNAERVARHRALHPKPVTKPVTKPSPAQDAADKEIAELKAERDRYKRIAESTRRLAMLIDLYSVKDDDSESLEASGVTIESCFPDDPESAETVKSEILMEGVAYYGGGAAPLFKFVPGGTK